MKLRNRMIAAVLSGVILITLAAVIPIVLFIFMGWFTLFTFVILGGYVGYRVEMANRKDEVDSWLGHLGVERH